MIVGLTFEKYVEQNLRSPLISVVTLVVFALLIYVAERMGKQNRSLGQINLGDSICVGASQALALIPGVSRSGITISTGLLRGLDRNSAARFSFLLATPVIAGAALLQGWRLVKIARHPELAAAAGALTSTGGIKWAVLASGVTSAVVVGFLCIRFFLRYIQKNGFLPFVIYRIVLALVVLFLYFRHVA
jgi:undecaprenyl-diphosphatase